MASGPLKDHELWPWDRVVDAKDLDRPPWLRFVRYFARDVVAGVVALLFAAILAIASGFSLVHSTDQFLAARVAKLAISHSDIGTLADFLISNGEIGREKAQTLLSVVSAVRSSTNPEVKLAEFSAIATALNVHPQFAHRTLNYFVNMPIDARIGLLARPYEHWMQVSRRLSEFEPSHYSLRLTLDRLHRDEEEIRTHFSQLQERINKFRGCQPVLDRLRQCMR